MIIERIGPHHLKISAPAKINLFLEVTGKRPDGFHELDTIMHSVDLYDELDLRLDEATSFKAAGREMGPDEDNLILKAVRLFNQHLGREQGFCIHLEKRIPVGAGLGGGSSDCAAALLGCNELLDRPFTRDQLSHMAAALGSDIPFFLHCGTARCTGRGEKVSPIPGIEKLHFLIIYPGFSVMTRQVFQNLNLGLTGFKNHSKLLSALSASNKLYIINRHLFNRLEASVFESVPDMRAAGELLRKAGFILLRVTGSGSSFFQVLEEEEIRDTEAKLYHLDRSWEWFLVQSSPTITPLTRGKS